ERLGRGEGDAVAGTALTATERVSLREQLERAVGVAELQVRPAEQVAVDRDLLGPEQRLVDLREAGDGLLGAAELHEGPRQAEALRLALGDRRQLHGLGEGLGSALPLPHGL